MSWRISLISLLSKLREIIEDNFPENHLRRTPTSNISICISRTEFIEDGITWYYICDSYKYALRRKRKRCGSPTLHNTWLHSAGYIRERICRHIKWKFSSHLVGKQSNQILYNNSRSNLVYFSSSRARFILLLYRGHPKSQEKCFLTCAVPSQSRDQGSLGYTSTKNVFNGNVFISTQIEQKTQVESVFSVLPAKRVHF